MHSTDSMFTFQVEKKRERPEEKAPRGARVVLINLCLYMMMHLHIFRYVIIHISLPVDFTEHKIHCT